MADKEIKVRLYSNSSEFRGEMSAVARQMKLVKSEFDENRTSVGTWGNELKQSESKLNLLNKQIDIQKRKIDALKKAYDESAEKKGADARETENLAIRLNKANSELNSFQNEVTQTTDKINKLQAEMKKQNSVVSKFGSAMDKAGQKMSSIGTSVGIAASTGVAAVGFAMKDAIGIGMEFGKQVSRVGAIAEATSSQMKQLKDQALKLGAATTKSASEVAIGQEQLAASGFKVNEILGAMPGVISAAEASGESMATVSEIMAAAIRGFGLEAKESSHIADVFAMAANRSNASISDMGYSFKYAAPIAKQLNISVEELAAVTGILRDRGMAAEQVGTSMRMGLSRLVAPTDKASEAMDFLGFNVMNSEGKMRPLAEILKELQDKLKGYSDSQKIATLKTIFGVEAMTGWMNLIDAGPDALTELTNALEKSDGASKKAADTMKDNLAGAVEEMNGALETAKINLTDSLTPALTTAANFIGKLADKWIALDDDTQKTIATTGALGLAITAVVGVVGTLTAAVGALLTFSGPIGLAIVGITTGLGALGLALFAAHEHTENLKKKQEEAEKTARRYGDGLSSGTKKAVKGYNDLYEGAKLKMIELQNMSGEKAKATSKEVVDAFSDMADQVITALETQKQKLANAINEVYDIAGDKGKEKAKEMTNTVLESFDKDIADYKKALDTVKEAHEKYSNDISKMPPEFRMQYQEALSIMEGGAKEFAKSQDELRNIQQAITDKQGKVLAEEAQKYTKSIDETYNKSIKSANKYYADKQEIFEQALAQGRINQEQYDSLMSGVESKTNQMLSQAAQERDKALSTLAKHLDERGKLIDIATGKEFEKQKKYISTATGYIYATEESTSEYMERWRKHTEEVLKSTDKFSKKTKAEYEKDLAAFLQSTGLTKAEAVKLAKQMVDESLNEMSKGDDRAKQAGENKGKAHNDGLNSTTSKNMRTAEQIRKEVTGELSKTTDGGGGKKAGEELSNGILSKYSTVFKSATGLANRGKEGLKSVKTEDAGQGFVSGFIRSISVASTGNSVFNAAWNLGKSALSALKKSIDSHSPSKETEKEGKNYVAGFVNAIGNGTSGAVQSAVKMAKATNKAFSDETSKMAYTIAGAAQEIRANSSELTVRNKMEIPSMDKLTELFSKFLSTMNTKPVEVNLTYYGSDSIENDAKDMIDIIEDQLYSRSTNRMRVMGVSR